MTEGEVLRPFLITPFTDYSVTEGMLLFIVFILFCICLWSIIKEVF